MCYPGTEFKICFGTKAIYSYFRKYIWSKLGIHNKHTAIYIAGSMVFARVPTKILYRITRNGVSSI